MSDGAIELIGGEPASGDAATVPAAATDARSAAAGARRGAILEVLARAGLRRGELCALRWDDIVEVPRWPDPRLRDAVAERPADETAWALNVEHSKRSRSRLVPLARPVVAALEAWRTTSASAGARQRGPRPRVFISLTRARQQDGLPLAPGAIGKIVAGYAAATGLPPELRTPNVLRHTSAPRSPSAKASTSSPSSPATPTCAPASATSQSQPPAPAAPLTRRSARARSPAPGVRAADRAPSGSGWIVTTGSQDDVIMTAWMTELLAHRHGKQARAHAHRGPDRHLLRPARSAPVHAHALRRRPKS